MEEGGEIHTQDCLDMFPDNGLEKVQNGFISEWSSGSELSAGSIHFTVG